MKKYYFLLISIAIIIMMLAACSKTTETPTEEPTTEETPQTTSDAIAKYESVPNGVSPLTGLPYDGDGRAIMVQLENTPAARPQSGITQANLIYEMEVEAKITRLTTFFLSTYPKKVGPVRSARKQHMELWSEWDYPYTHFGGSEYNPGQNIYELKQTLGISAPNIDGTKTTASYSRSSDRKAPHNAYTDTTYTIKKNYDYEPKQRSIYFDQKAKIEGDSAEEVSLTYNPNNKIKYVYNSKTNLYERSINGEPMIDKENNEQLAVKNIIIQHTEHFNVTDTMYTNIKLIGSGKAEYFTDGVMRSGTWQRKNVDSLTLYFDENGKEIPFKPGVTFIQIVRTDTSINVE